MMNQLGKHGTSSGMPSVMASAICSTAPLAALRVAEGLPLLGAAAAGAETGAAILRADDGYVVFLNQQTQSVKFDCLYLN
jgi:hypothetical protein